MTGEMGPDGSGNSGVAPVARQPGHGGGGKLRAREAAAPGKRRCVLGLFAVVDSERIDNDAAENLSFTLLHESMHDMFMYGPTHANIYRVLDEYRKFIDILKTPDCTGARSWARIRGDWDQSR